MNVRGRCLLALVVGCCQFADPLFAQSLRESRTVWASDPADVPALATLMDGMSSRGELELTRIQRDGQLQGRIHERLDQYHRGVPVLGGQLVAQKEAGYIHSITGNLYDGIDVDVVPAIDPGRAEAVALAGGMPGTRVVGRTELLVLPLRERFVLAYSLHLRGNATLERIFVDAHSGEIVLRYRDDRAQTASVGLGVGTWSDEKKMTVEMAGGTFRTVDRVRPFGIETYDVRFDFDSWNFYEADTPAFLATDGDNEWRDGAVVDAHAYSGFTYDYYFKRHGRRGLDDQGRAAINFVHFIPRAAGFNNAFFDAVDVSMNFGDGDGVTFNYFSSALDVVAHELTHGVVRFTADFIYMFESGALDEAMADIIGASVEFFFEPAGSGRKRAEWLLGEDLYYNFGPAIRSMSNPQSLGDPDHYDIRCRCPADFDNGGVHIDSNIVGHAFYLMVVGGTNRTSGMTVTGIGMEQMDHIESIFYRGFNFYLVPSSDFSDAREATLRAARELFGAGSLEERTVRSGWNAVGVQ